MKKRTIVCLLFVTVLTVVLTLVFGCVFANAEKMSKFDVNRDREVNILDVTKVLDVIAGAESYLPSADVSGNSVVNINDVTILLTQLAKAEILEPDKSIDPQTWLQWLINVDAWEDEPEYLQASAGNVYTITHEGATVGSPWEYWGNHFQFDYTFAKSDFNTAFSGTEANYSMEIWYKDDDVEEPYRMITTAPWSYYDVGAAVICRIPTYEKGMRDLHTDDGAPNEYEFIMLFYDESGKLACWKQDWITVSNSYEMFLQDALNAHSVTENSDPVPAPGPEAIRSYVSPTLNREVVQPHLTEDDLDVIHVGLYEFVLDDGRKLGYDEDRNLILVPANGDAMPFLVSFQNSGKDSTGRAGVRYVLYAGDTIDYALRCSYSSVSVASAIDYANTFNWYIEENEDGSVSLKNVSYGRYLTVKGDSFFARTVPEDGELDTFHMELLSEGTSVFHQTISGKGNIILRFSDKITNRGKLSLDREAKLANDLQLAYESYYDLTGFLVWESIIVRAYRTEPYFGYIYPNWNVISFNLGNAVDDLGMIPKRDKVGINDWNFCLLHEMGHMFDAYRGWKFDAEFCTDLKVAYVLYKNSELNAKAATAGRAVEDVYGLNYKEMWNSCPRMTEETGFNFDRLVYLFVDYCETIGWENVKKAYHEIQAMPKQDTNKLNCYTLFTATLQKYAPDGRHIEDYMYEGEKEIIIANITA